MKWTRRFLLFGGIAMLGVWAWSEVRYAVGQDWGGWVFDRELHHQSATVADYLLEKGDQLIADLGAWTGTKLARRTPPPSPVVISPVVPRSSIMHNSLIGRLTIPRLHLSGVVREGAEEDTLALALGHIPTTALPGQNGNVGIAGHRDKLFRDLRGIRQDDLIEFETLTGRYVYQVGSTGIVKPSDVSVLRARNSAELTLVTCYPFYYVGSAPDRFVVKAHQVSSKPAEKIQMAQLERTTHEASTVRLVAIGPEPPQTGGAGGRGRVGFNVPKNHSRQLAPGIWFGVTDTDVVSHAVNGWMWLMPDRRTIWLRNRGADDPIVFYSIRDGKRRELRLTNVTANSATGYLSSSD